MSGFVKISNNIFDCNLTSTELLVYCYLCSKRNVLSAITIKHDSVADALGVSRNTVGTALKGLEDKQLVNKTKRYYRGYRVANRYHVSTIRGKWFKLPREIFDLQLEKSDFAVYLYLLRCANAKGMGFPSTSKISKACGVCAPRVRDAVKALTKYSLLHKKRAIRLCGAYGCNNYKVYTIAQRQILLKRYRKSKKQSIVQKLRTVFILMSQFVMCKNYKPQHIFHLFIRFRGKHIFLII